MADTYEIQSNIASETSRLQFRIWVSIDLVNVYLMNTIKITSYLNRSSFMLFIHSFRINTVCVFDFLQPISNYSLLTKNIKMEHFHFLHFHFLSTRCYIKFHTHVLPDPRLEGHPWHAKGFFQG